MTWPTETAVSFRDGRRRKTSIDNQPWGAAAATQSVLRGPHTEACSPTSTPTPFPTMELNLLVAIGRHPLYFLLRAAPVPGTTDYAVVSHSARFDEPAGVMEIKIQELDPDEYPDLDPSLARLVVTRTSGSILTLAALHEKLREAHEEEEAFGHRVEATSDIETLINLVVHAANNASLAVSLNGPATPVHYVK